MRRLDNRQQNRYLDNKSLYQNNENALKRCILRKVFWMENEQGTKP